MCEVARLDGANFSGDGVRKMLVAFRCDGWEVRRDQVARLMKVAGAQGARRGREVFTTRSDTRGTFPVDLVERRSTADSSGRSWVAANTYFATWFGFAYTAFGAHVSGAR